MLLKFPEVDFFAYVEHPECLAVDESITCQEESLVHARKNSFPFLPKTWCAEKLCPKVFRGKSMRSGYQTASIIRGSGETQVDLQGHQSLQSDLRPVTHTQPNIPHRFVATRITWSRRE